MSLNVHHHQNNAAGKSAEMAMEKGNSVTAGNFALGLQFRQLRGDHRALAIAMVSFPTKVTMNNSPTQEKGNPVTVENFAFDLYFG